MVVLATYTPELTAYTNSSPKLQLQLFDYVQQNRQGGF
jgi:hypothetical protein